MLVTSSLRSYIITYPWRQQWRRSGKENEQQGNKEKKNHPRRRNNITMQPSSSSSSTSHHYQQQQQQQQWFIFILWTSTKYKNTPCPSLLTDYMIDPPRASLFFFFRASSSSSFLYFTPCWWRSGVSTNFPSRHSGRGGGGIYTRLDHHHLHRLPV